MNFLIFVGTFVTLACVVLPLLTLAVFAALRDAETGVEARSGKATPSGVASDDSRSTSEDCDRGGANQIRQSTLDNRKPGLPSPRRQTVVT